MSSQLQQLTNTLRLHGNSNTVARKTVFTALHGRGPQTMHDLVAACQNTINRASVYRVIALFEQLGIVQRLQIGWKYQLELSDAFHSHHHHITCTNCGTIRTMPEQNELETILQKTAESIGFKMRGHQLEIYGLCSTCAEAVI